VIGHGRVTGVVIEDTDSGDQRVIDRHQKAKAVCAKCPVVAQCREHALRFGEDFGTWGGLSEDDRDLSHRQVRRR
jgi:WhiB family redox-sensing transcriptional regulator